MLPCSPSRSVLLALTSLAVPLAFSNDWYVDRNAPSCASGTGGPLDPFCTIQRAIDAASNGDRVLIAPGTYPENLTIATDLDLIGTAGRDLTILDGRNRRRGVVVRPGITGTISGLTIMNGTTYYTPYGHVGGGGLKLEEAVVADPTTFVLRSSTVTRCSAEGWAGGIDTGENCSLEILDCMINNNGAFSCDFARGGGIQSLGPLTISNSTIRGNTASAVYAQAGIALFVAGGPCTIENTLIVGHERASQGGSITTVTTIAGSSSLVMRNCTVAFNGVTTRYPTGRQCLTGAQLVENCIFYDNAGEEIGSTTTIVNYTNIDGGWSGPGTGNIYASPRFVNPAGNRFDLQPGSFCIDAGDPRARRTGVDHDGNPRVLDGNFDRVQRIDMGYVEFTKVRLSAEVLPTHELNLSTPRSRPGLTLFLIGGFGAGEVNFAPWGPLFVDPGTLALIEPIGATPTRQTYAIPPSLFGTDVVLQLLALGAPLGSGARPGNFSNAVALTLE